MHSGTEGGGGRIENARERARARERGIETRARFLSEVRAHLRCGVSQSGGHSAPYEPLEMFIQLRVRRVRVCRFVASRSVGDCVRAWCERPVPRGLFAQNDEIGTTCK